MQEGGQIVRCEIEHFNIFKNIRSREGIISQQCYTTMININNKKKVQLVKIISRDGFSENSYIESRYFSFSSPSVGGRIDDQTGRETREKISKWTRESSLLRT